MLYTQHVYTDFDEFASSVREVDCQMMAHNPDFHRWSLTIAETGAIEVQFGKLGTGNILEGTSWKNGILIYSPLSLKTRYRLNGEAIENDAFMIVEPNAHFDLSSDGAHNWCSVFLPNECLPLGNFSQPRSYATLANSVLSQQFRLLVSAVLTASKASDGFSQSAAGKSAETALISICRQILCANGMETETILGRKKLDRYKIIRAARELGEGIDSGSIKISKIAKKLSVSERTLRDVFNEFYSIGPKKFFELTAMRSVRDELVSSDPAETSVGDILSAHGIFQFGRFAVNYRRAYGERPSESLKNPASYRTM